MDPALINRVKEGSMTTLNLSKQGKRRQKRGSSKGSGDLMSEYGEVDSKEESKEESLNNSPELAALLAALADNKSVTQLRMDMHGLDMQAARLISNAMQRNTGIKVLSLAGNKLGPEEAVALCQALQFNKSLQVLDLSSNELHDEGAQAIANLLRRNTTLQHLELTTCAIYRKGAASLFQALQINSSLLSLLLAHNHCLADGARELAIALTTNLTLSLIDLSHNFLFAEGAKEIAKGLCASMVGFPGTSTSSSGSSGAESQGLSGPDIATLELRLGSNELGDAGAKALASALTVKGSRIAGKSKSESGGVLTRLRTLLLPDNLITHKGAKELATAVASQSALTSLQLCDNPIGQKGAEALGKALKSSSCGLKVLKLMACEIPANGIKLLCKFMGDRRRKDHLPHQKEKNAGGKKAAAGGFGLLSMTGDRSLQSWLPSGFSKGLMWLDLSWNRFGPEGGRYLGDMLARNSSLQRLMVAHNKLQCQGAVSIAGGLRGNTGLRELDLASNHIRGSGLAALAKMMTQQTDTPMLLELKLEGNSLEGPGFEKNMEEIDGRLAENTQAEIQQVKLTFLMALHPRVGQLSSLRKVLEQSAIADANSLRGIWDALFGPRHAASRVTSS